MYTKDIILGEKKPINIDSEKMNTIDIVAEEVKSRILDFMPDEFLDCNVRIDKVTKPGDVVLHGMSLTKGKNGAVPMLYLEPYARQFEDGMSMENVLYEIAAEYSKLMRITPSIEAPDLQFDKIKDNLRLRALYTRTNGDLLKDLVYTNVGNDYVLAVYADMSNDLFDGAIINIREEMLEHIGCEKGELIYEALKSSENHSPARLTYIQEELGRHVLGSEPRDLLSGDEPYNPENGILVLSTEDRFAGAAALFYPWVQREIAEFVGESYFVLPSSTHEVLILPDNGAHAPEALAQMVKAINENEVSPDERLGNRVLYYDAMTLQLDVACDLDRDMDKDRDKEIEAER